VTALPAQLLLPAAPLDANANWALHTQQREHTITVFEPKSA